jgi:hypothetical protein
VSWTSLRDARRAAAQRTWAATSGDVSSDYARFRAQGLSELASAPLVYARVHAAGVVRVLLEPGAVEYYRVLGWYPENGGLLAVAHERGLVVALAELAAERPGLLRLTLGLGMWVAAIFAAATWGFARLWRSGRPGDARLLAAWAAYFIVLSGGAHGLSRFRHPVVPVLCVCAGAALPVPRGQRPVFRSPAPLAATPV